MNTSVTVSVSVMAHPSRATRAEALARSIDQLPVRVVYDPDPLGPSSTVRTAREAWRPWLAGASHHLVIQDDVVLHADFQAQVIAATTSQPDAILSFFSEWGSFTSHALRVAAFAGYSWVSQPDTYLGTQAALMPAAAARRFAEELLDVGADVPDDHAVHAFAYRHALAHYVSNPNLVEHEVNPSLVGNGVQGARRATVFLPHRSADLSWWGRPPMTRLAVVPSVHWTTAQPISYVRPARPGARWNIETRRHLWGDMGGVIDRSIEELVHQVSGATGDAETSRALRAVVSILSDQVAVASCLPVLDRHDLAAEAEQSAISTIGPGCLRKIEIETGVRLDPDELTSALMAFVAHLRDVEVPRIDQERVRSDHIDHKTVSS